MRFSLTTPLLLTLMMGCEAPADDTDGDSDTDTDTGTEAALQDADLDGIADSADNCPDDANTDQANADEDAAGDACDPCPNDPSNDADNDGVCGDEDGCPEVDDDQTDSDGDGVGDACDVCDFDADNDIDDDGLCSDLDLCPDVSDPDQLDTDGDGFGDACECADETYRDYTDGSCAICPAAGLDQEIIDFDSAETRYDSATNTLRFALRDDVQIVSATATIVGVSFDEYGSDGLDVEESLTGTVQGRVVIIDLDDLVELDVYADGFTDVRLTVVDGCGDSLTLDNLTISAPPSDTVLEPDHFRYSICGELDLGNVIGNAVSTGDTTGQGKDASAAGELQTRSDDVTLRWTAPSTSEFFVDTFTSPFDTVLYALADDCTGAPIAANDNTLASVSLIRLTLNAGDSVVLVVAGRADATGEYILNIRDSADL